MGSKLNKGDIVDDFNIASLMLQGSKTYTV